jgi:hypothetical protein
MNETEPRKLLLECGGQSVTLRASVNSDGQWSMSSSDYIACGRSKYDRSVMNNMLPKEIATREEAEKEAEARLRRAITIPPVHNKSHVSYSDREIIRELDRLDACDAEMYALGAAEGYTDEEIDDLDQMGMIDEFGNVMEI